MRGLSKGPPSARWWRRGHPRGLLVVPNGLALCALHHAAFDRNVLGVRPDLRVEVRLDVLEEEDGPMLEHGLQGFHGVVVMVPRAEHSRPNREFLAERYEMFRRAWGESHPPESKR